jgi:hypothetical protein
MRRTRDLVDKLPKQKAYDEKNARRGYPQEEPSSMIRDYSTEVLLCRVSSLCETVSTQPK